MAKEISQKKVKGMARAMRVVMQVFYWFSVIAVIAGVLGFVILYFIPDKYFVIAAGTKPGLNMSLDGMLRFELEPVVNTDLHIRPFIQSVSLLVAVLMVGAAGICRALRDIMQTVMDDRPFVKENSKRLTTIGAIFLIGSGVVNIVQAYVATTFIHVFQLQNVSVNLSADAFMLLTGFMMLVLAGVFRYGSFLQEEYDSTL